MIPQQRQRMEATYDILLAFFIGKGREDKHIAVIQKITGHTIIVRSYVLLQML